jgi:hypothetical protein
MIIFSGANSGETGWDRSTFYPAQYGAFNSAYNGHESGFSKECKKDATGKCINVKCLCNVRSNVVFEP